MPEQTCEWCGKSLEGKKALQSAATPPIQAIREEQEAETERWATVVDEAIRLYFRERPGEPFHADDIEHLGVPDLYRKSVVGSQIAKWVNRRWMAECGRRKSVIPSRNGAKSNENGAKSNEYRLTEKGQKVIAGDGADTPRVLPAEEGCAREQRGNGEAGCSPVVTVVSGDSRIDNPVSGAGVPKAQAEGGFPCSRESAGTAPPEPSEEGRLFDLSEAAERPLHPLTDREAA